MLRDLPGNGTAVLRALAPSLSRAIRDRLSGRAAIALVGGTNLILWAGLISFAVRLFR